ncbi:hypothetical protein EW146_g1094 [Bondarzewia mesenterica]|uniref:Uncharacterized protein n=1 Tax=Bondarzewia mesenterica TaxID=1095465 RepID=A0A4S4MB94_9AGAM|nr:hypothetical protein EW146_g1094 [Bondarzewia mesenterica]
MAKLPAHTISPSTSDPAFVPRREFIRDERAPSTFSILALSGSALIRVFNFPASLIAALRRYFDQHRLVISFREDVTHNLCEYGLDGKPWASPKSTFTEKLIVSIIAVLYQNGFEFLSTIDYGREQDDRLVMAFSKPSSAPRPLSPTASPFPPPSSTLSHNSSVTSPLKVPFAISFPNATTLRVISAPLHCTPAILQTVRGAWPRGVVSEKKVGDTVYEFKLRGYGWFQEDTFAIDSLHQVLALLGSLDLYGFTLLCSLSLANRSRVKDLWIFTGISLEPTTESHSPSPDLFKSESRRAATPDEFAPTSGHGRYSTSPTPGHPAHPDGHSHVRGATDNGPAHHVGQPSPLSPSHVLRKAAPRAQLPVAVAKLNGSQDNLPTKPVLGAPPRAEEELVRVPLPSTVDMTGVGAGGSQAKRLLARREDFHRVGHHTPEPTPTVFYTTISPRIPHFHQTTEHENENTSPAGSGARASRPHLAAQKRVSEQPVIPTAPSHLPPATAVQSKPSTGSNASTVTPPLLSPGVFRDSAFSTSTGQTYEIPITWTGVEQGKGAKDRSTRDLTLPGGLKSPAKEIGREEVEHRVDDHDHTHNDLRIPEFGTRKDDERAVKHRVKVSEPELVRQEHERKSESPSHGVVPRRQKRPESAPLEGMRAKERGSGGQKPEGWVLVNIGQTGAPNSPSARSGLVTSRPSRAARSASDPSLSRSVLRLDGNANRSTHRIRADSATPPNMTPAAKAIVIIDAVEAKKGKGKGSHADDASQPHASSSLGRLFAHGKQNPSGKMRKRPPPSLLASSTTFTNDEMGKTKNLEQEESPERKRVGLKERWRRIGTVEASRAAHRVSVDGA